MKQSDILAGVETFTGEDLRTQFLNHLNFIESSIKSSYGPLGSDKMIIDESGDVIISNDGATILKHLHTNDPFALIVAQLAQSQDAEVGDGTTGVVLLAIELIRSGLEMMKKEIHHTEILKGYRNSYKKTVEILEKMAKKIEFTENLQKYLKTKKPEIKLTEEESKTRTTLENIIKTTICSKIIKNESQLFTKLILESMSKIYQKNDIDLNKIRILKKEGESMSETKLYDGFLFNCTPSTTKEKLDNCNIAILNFDLKKKTLPLSVKIKVEKPEDLENIRQLETELNLIRLKTLLKAGVDVFLTTRGIDDVYLNLIEKSGKIAVRRLSEDDNTMLKKVLDIEEIDARDVDDLTEFYENNNEEQIESSVVIKSLKKVELFSVEKVSNSKCCLIKTDKTASFLLRGGSYVLLDEIHRALHDALCAVESVLREESIVPAGGATECFVSSQLQDSDNIVELKFSESILVTLKNLLKNCGMKFHEIIPQILSQQKIEGSNIGINAYTGEVRDNVLAGVIEPLEVRKRGLRAAVEAAISVLRISTRINVPEQKKEMKSGCGE